MITTEPHAAMRRESSTRCQLLHATGWHDVTLDESLTGSDCPLKLLGGDWRISPARFSERVREGTARRVRHVGTLHLDFGAGEGFRPVPSC